MGHVQGDNNYRMPTSPSASILLFLLIRFTTDPVLSEGSFRFTHPIQNIATGREHIVVATEDNLHLFNHMLQIQAVRHPGLLDGRKRNCRGNEAESQVYYNKILLVYNDIILSCWNKNSGTCREYSVNNLTLLKGYGEDIVSCNPEHTAAGFIFQKDKIFFVTAAPTLKGAFGRRTIVIREKNAEDTFTFLEGVELKIQSPVPNIVDAFEWKEKFIFPYYPSNEMRARLLVLDWSDGSLSLNSQYNLTCGTDTQRGVILSSFAFASSGSFFWAGIFSTNNSTSLDKTALCIYNITLLENRSKGCIYTDFDVFNEFPCENYDNPLPIHSKPTISHGDLTAVYVMEVQKTLVLFLGTGNGQLLKVILDSNYTASCPQVLHKFEAEAAVFKTMHLDPVDNTYLYVATVNEIKRVRIAKCEHHQSCSECLSAADPHCGWCQLKKRCTMKAECASDTLLENWIEKFPADMSQTDCKPIKHMPAIGPSCTSPQSVYTLLIPYLDWCLLLLLLHCCIDILLF